MNRYSRIIFTLFALGFCLSPSLLSAQFMESTDVILNCKDGSIYKGQIIEETKDFFKIAILENDTIIVSKDLLKTIERGSDYLYFRKGRRHKMQGFFLGSHYGMNIPSPESQEDNYSRHLQILFGYQFDSRRSLGISLGIAVDDVNVSGIWATKGYFSPSIFGRYYLNDKRFRAFVYSQIGYGFEFEIEEPDPQHGFTMQNGIGIHLASRKRSKLLFSVGHYLQRSKGSDQFFDTFNNEVKVEFKHWISRPMFKIGIEIN